MKKPVKPVSVDNSVHLSNCSATNLDAGKHEAMTALARAAQANAEAIKQIAQGFSAAGSVGFNIATARDQ